MHEIFISVCKKKGMYEIEHILQFLPGLTISGNYETSKEVVEWSVKERRSKEKWNG